MHYEENERRDFTPNLFKNLKSYDIDLYLESGYGRKLGFTHDDYRKANPNVQFVDIFDVFQKDLIVVIRSPQTEQIEKMKEGALLFSMLHYPTHEKRNALMQKLGIIPISMDMVTDDLGKRYIEDYVGTAFNAINAAFETWLKLGSNGKRLRINVTILGTGGIGRLVADAAVHYGGNVIELEPSVVVTSLGRNSTMNKELMKEILMKTDILADATLRHNTSKYIITNSQLGFLPKHSVVLDITADDYDTSVEPIQVKGIEGIPTGFIDNYVFNPQDDSFDTIPTGVRTENRRDVVSCYSWPGVVPLNCVKRYETQLLPFIELLTRKPVRNLDEFIPLERAIVRGLFSSYSQQQVMD